MDIKKELNEVQKKIDDIKKTQETLQKIQEMQEKQNKSKGIQPFSHNYEMMWYNTYLKSNQSWLT